MQPLLHIVERLQVCHVIDDNDAVGAPVVRRRDRAEPLLASRVPNLRNKRLAPTCHPPASHLKLNCLAIEFYCSDLEVDANRRDIALGVSVVSETQQKTRLSDATVADEQQFEQIVASIDRETTVSDSSFKT